ncbi:MAG: lipopolysaccharide transport system ATP-binding protein [Pyrinomonadaceae bacterium]|nr:lipopolysaccharide transport system ATP-binding protein [Pyrinomonadaceae bacterium]
MATIIRVEHLGKQYRIGGPSAAYSTLRETLVGAARAPLRWATRKRGEGHNGQSRIWAVKDVSFEVQAGEVVGIIGRNGAGKSTLLKLLSRITEPTTGSVDLYGRVGSLLEVGTGFHPELSGRENVYLNGAILGMARQEIAQKFDEIVAFAEVEKFIDTPVKHYSSGMYLRLAFAVAAHLEPEILIVDEVLAVGDARFQRKCLDKMRTVGQQGRTVLFVSHNMPAITRLCPRTIMLSEGGVLEDGPSHLVVSTYLNSGLGTVAAREWADASKAPGNDIVRLRAVRVVTEAGATIEAVDIRKPVGIEVTFDVLREGHLLVPNMAFYNEESVLIFMAHDTEPEWRARARTVGRHTSTAWVPGNFFAEGSITVDVAVSSHVPSVEVHLHESDAVAFQVIDSLDGDSARGDFAGPIPGVVRPRLRWTNEFRGEEASSASAAGVLANSPTAAR